MGKNLIYDVKADERSHKDVSDTTRATDHRIFTRRANRYFRPSITSSLAMMLTTRNNSNQWRRVWRAKVLSHYLYIILDGTEAHVKSERIPRRFNMSTYYLHRRCVKTRYKRRKGFTWRVFLRRHNGIQAIPHHATFTIKNQDHEQAARTPNQGLCFVILTILGKYVLWRLGPRLVMEVRGSHERLKIYL